MRDIVKDIEILSKISAEITDKEELDKIISDMREVIDANFDNCAGLTAIQIGYEKKVIMVRKNDSFFVMVNPKIVAKMGSSYTAVEGCLSLDGTRQVKRFPVVMVKYQDINFKTITAKFEARVAQIIQHEVDHTVGVII